MPKKVEYNTLSKDDFDRLINKYKGKIKPDILRQYSMPDKYVLLNEDKHLHPIYIEISKLSKTPEWDTIEGWGLPAKEQKFKHIKMPDKLRKLVERIGKLEDIWKELMENQYLYRSEIKFIEEQWRKYFEGHWLFINGKPTWICGWHYTYLNWWRFKNGGRPGYRDRNRRFMIGMYYAYTTTETVSYDSQGRIEYVDENLRIPKMIDTGFRTCLGVSYPKHRKDGASNMCLLAEYMEVITHKGVVGGIISMTGDHAKEKLFDEIMVPGWNAMPFFFKPITTSNKNPGSEINFVQSRVRADNLSSYELGSTISYSTTSTSKLYDGGNNKWITVDETGKTTDCDTYERHRQLKPCVSLGNGANIFGFLAYPSTVGEMQGSGGLNFFRICQDSKFEKRDISGQTSSGMFVFYLPAYDGLDGFIGPYGESVIETPTPEQAKFIGKDYGAKQFLENKRSQLLAEQNMDGYNEECRLFPMSYMECFRTEDGEVGFNTKIINERLDDLTYIYSEEVRIGNFARVDKNDPNSFVVFQDDPKGKFCLSLLLDEKQTNMYYEKDIGGQYGRQRFPYKPKFTASSDAYKFEKVRGSRMSMGAGTVFWDYDPDIDQNSPIENWITHRFVCDYLYRPQTKDEYCEDMLMMCEYFGAMMYPEIDVPIVWEHFEKRKRIGYLLYDIDFKTNKPMATPGFNSKGKKQNLFSSIRDYIEVHGRREKHKRVLEQWKDITSIEEMTDFDLVTTTGGCLMATKGIERYQPNHKRDNMVEQKQTMLYPKMKYG